jgi:hypothetical protein
MKLYYILLGLCLASCTRSGCDKEAKDSPKIPDTPPAAAQVAEKKPQITEYPS